EGHARATGSGVPLPPGRADGLLRTDGYRHEVDQKRNPAELLLDRGIAERSCAGQLQEIFRLPGRPGVFPGMPVPVQEPGRDVDPAPRVPERLSLINLSGFGA